MNRVFVEAMRELLHVGAVGSWKWLRKWRKADRRARQLWLQVRGEREKDNS